SIEQLLADLALQVGDLDAMAVVLGPGSFTGLRVGIATAKGLALATGVPVVGVSSLLALAGQVCFSRHPVCALLDARKKEVYAGRFHCEGAAPVAATPETVLSPERLLEGIVDDTLFVGNGATVYRNLIIRQLGRRAHFAPRLFDSPRASGAAALALGCLRNGQTIPLPSLVPHYIRDSEAEISLRNRLADGVIRG
ncbi:MAG TPA: tRNA (adenosine(37)-N6)-threonylcarbamoyltransferase complex dimerization subunit type 1 TsaB, partial [Desulfuromonadales bacterium]|nr:tRNA (adenosine(37)-N6)-threonylcarbamoyltransferase complex dimerization subunit type 1 TsaB [Desulfuromonadales bacterium]